MSLPLVNANVVDLHESAVDGISNFPTPGNDGEAEPDGSRAVTEGVFFTTNFFSVEIKYQFFFRPFETVGLEVVRKVILAGVAIELGDGHPSIAVVVFDVIVFHGATPRFFVRPALDKLKASDLTFAGQRKLERLDSIGLSDPALGDDAIRYTRGAVVLGRIRAAGADTSASFPSEIDEARLVFVGGF